MFVSNFPIKARFQTVEESKELFLKNDDLEDDGNEIRKNVVLFQAWQIVLLVVRKTRQGGRDK